jgi:hypothetical protein
MKFKFIGILLVFILSYSNVQSQNFSYTAPTKSVRYSRNEQKYNSYPMWLKRQPKVRRQAAVENKRQKKRVARKERKRERLLNFEERKRTSID